MGNDNIKKIYALLNSVPQTSENIEVISEIKELLVNGRFEEAVEKLQALQMEENEEDSDIEEEEYVEDEELVEDEEDDDDEVKTFVEDDVDANLSPEEYEKLRKDKKKKVEEKKEETKIYPEPLRNPELERKFIGHLLNDPRQIVKYYFPFRDCMFEDPALLNMYKNVLFIDGGSFSSEKAKEGFNFAKDTEEAYKLKIDLKKEMKDDPENMEELFIELKKLFILRKNYQEMPIEGIQAGIVEIIKYELYKEMSPEEIESAIRQVMDTKKFKRGILNANLSTFLRMGDNNLTNGIALPFPILTSVFKGIRKGETIAFSMPSNTGKSRLTVDLAAYTAFIHKKKVLIISNEMSEEKMKLCLITTIINQPDIKKIHGQDVKITEGELLEFKFRPDKKTGVKTDENGYVLKEEKETQAHFAKRLSEISSDYNKVIAVTDWVNKELNNSIYFINITDHTNDEIRKVIMNYYYKEKIEYVFYDTLKTDTANIGIGEELKKTATILSNLAQNFEMFICSTLQLTETSTLPINLSVNDLAVSRTVKEVLDTLTLVKQINRDNLKDYEYSINEVDTEFFDLYNDPDPDIRYYAFVVDKNRAGPKPRLVFRINLAYNSWEELGYLRLKQQDEEMN